MKKHALLLSAAFLALNLSSCATAKKEACATCSSCTAEAPAVDKQAGVSALKKAAAATPQGQAANAAMKAADAAQKAQ